MATATTERPAEPTPGAYLAQKFRPIILDEHGNAIEALAEGTGPTLLGDEVRPSPPNRYIGRHSVCNGAFVRITSSSKCDALVCACGFRHHIPVGKLTFADLLAQRSRFNA